jgi:hypothetical protein
MARIRTIKPEWFVSPTLARVSVEAERTFAGLLTHCDDDGRAIDAPKRITGALWVERDRTWQEVDRDLSDLAEVGLIRRYEVDGKRYLMIVNWREHQRINRPTPSRIPEPDISPKLF